MAVSTLALPVALVTLAACNKGPTPESMCESYVAARKSDGWPADASVQKACVKELEGAKKRFNEEAWKKFSGCFGETTTVTVDQTHDCVALWGRDAHDDNEGTGWNTGLASEASGAWADGKPEKLDAEACREGAFVIAERKLAFGLFKSPPEAKSHRKELEKACLDSKKDAAYAAQFACMRKATKQTDLAQCVSGGGGTASTPYGDPAVIEACVGKCSAQHGSQPTPAYLSCFDACKASGGR